ncbi:conserved Plasmodium protein, unknown function [Plasmodium ovale wallikeri]|uniref:Uncharacterized protein n=1 Tax=Plasmodium ovale wallikeri TaxID=864142 RepID=A0A1A8YJE2_PLAOA|nr:conserved Plasmodium protein, unknown function [Plasmodium ovale wallikeri]
MAKGYKYFAYWYRTSSIGHRNFFWVFIGSFCGYIYGKVEKNKKIKDNGIYGDLIYIDEYSVTKNNILNFEKKYNLLNAQTFKNKGYEYTKLFKAINWGDCPVNYLQLRLWKNKELYNIHMQNSNVANLLQDVKKECLSHTSDTYQTVVDDSIVRLIQGGDAEAVVQRRWYRSGDAEAVVQKRWCRGGGTEAVGDSFFQVSFFLFYPPMGEGVCGG